MSLSTSDRVTPHRNVGPETVAPSGTVPSSASRPVGTGQPGARGPGLRGRGRRGVRDLALGLVLPVVLLALWQGLVSAEVLDPSRYSTPSDVLAAFVAAVESGRLWPNVLVSVQRVLLGFAIGAALAVMIGVLVALSRTADKMLSPLLSAVRAVPSLAWVPLLILWYGIGEQPKIILIAIGAFFPVLATLVAGIRQVDRGLLEVAQAYGLSWRQRVTTVLLPSAAPSLLAGARLGLNQAWLFLVAAELIAAAQGLGWQLQNAQRNGQVELLLVTIILFALLGKLTDSMLAAVETKVLARLS